MIRFTLVMVLLCVWNVSYSQQISPHIDTIENPTMQDVLNAFEHQYQLDFSYDVEAIKNVKLSIDKGSIAIDSLPVVLQKQTSFTLEKVDDRSYIVVDRNETLTICGVVMDAVAPFELAQANIIKNKVVIQSTDAQGSFRVQVQPKDSVSISYLGYDTQTIPATAFSSSSCDTIRLQPKIQELNRVVIREYLTTGIQKSDDAAIQVSTKKLRILPGLVEPDVLQSLQLIPGISSPTEDPAGLHIRGGTPDQNLVLWDGIKMYHNGHFFNQISTFNPYIVKNVNVYRGGTSVRYGDRISGVIIIESDDDLTEKFKGGGGVNLTHADLFLKVPLTQKIGIMGAFRRSTTDFYQNVGYDNLVRKVFQNTRADIADDTEENTEDVGARDDNFSFYDANFKVVWNPSTTNSVQLSAIYAKNKLDNTIPSDPTNTFRTEDQYTIQNTGASLKWEKKYSNTSIQNININFSSFDTQYDTSRAAIGANQQFNYTQNNDLKDFGIQYALDIPMDKKRSIALGYQYAYNETRYRNMEQFTGDVNGSIPNDTGGQSNNHTLYTEYTYKGAKAYANFGLRGSYLSRTDQFFVEPRMFSSIALFKNFRLTASAELKNQQLNSYTDFGSLTPSILGLPIADRVWLLSGTISRDGESFFIPVVKSRQFTLGALYTYKGWNFDLEGYYKKLTNIASVNDPILEFSAIANNIEDIGIGKEERIGLDFLIKKRIQNYRFWIGYSLSSTQVNFPTLQQGYFPGNFDQQHVFNISQTLKVNQFEFALGWNYSTGKPFTKLIPDENGFAGNRIDPNGINTSRFKAYHRLDASVIYRFNFKTKNPWGGMLGFSLRNIYNRNNTIDQGFKEVGTDGILLETFEKRSLRLTPDVVIRFNF